MIENTPADLKKLTALLESARNVLFEIETASGLSTGITLLGSQTFDAVLLDLFLQESQGLGTLKTVSGKNPNIPIIVLTRLVDENTTMHAVEMGAQDYIVKDDMTTALLTKSIIYAIERKRTEEQLRQHSNDLERINEELDTFSYTAAHDLKAPLRTISNFSAFLLEDYSDKLDDEGKEYLNLIVDGARRMETLIDDLLSLSKISKIKNPYESINMVQLVNDAKDRLGMLIEEKNVLFRVDDNLPYAYGDAIKMEEVFFNLVANAIKYNESPQPVINLGVKNGEKGHVFFVKDNGIGILEEHFGLIFQIFHRLHGKEEYGGGTGIGLPIVKKIIEEHGGKVWVESEPGKGTTFFFSIPKKEGKKNE
ncbi:MAG: response regulator [bacterium]|nr:response regulator [bacterium]